MSRDILLIGMSQSVDNARLIAWMKTTPGLHEIPYPDFHRLQLEHWIWSKRGEMGRDILDVGVYYARRWLGEGYMTFGEHDEDKTGSLLALPFPDNSLDTVICTEVLEHCTDPQAAVNQMRRVLRPGGLLLVTSPFLWPWHGVDGEYNDYWRFTHQGWALLLKAFTGVQIQECEWTQEGAAAYEFLRRFEGMGFAQQTRASTGYLCEARKAAA